VSLSARKDPRRKAPRLLAAAAVLLGLALPSAAAASEVSVTDVLEQQHTVTLHFVSAPGETNLVTVKSTPLGKIEVVDDGAALVAGPGCTGGGPAGTPAECTVHAPKAPEQVFCGKNCVQWAPGTGWTDYIAADLGDGDDSFDASTLPYYLWIENFHMNVTGGTGDDSIHTGSGPDTIRPGMGNDHADGGKDGDDEFLAEAVPDGDDVFTMSAEHGSSVSYASRTTPLVMTGNTIGAEGEHDSLTGFFELTTGSGADRLEPLPARSIRLNTGAGDDVVSGGPGRETVYGGLGDDRLSGNEGEDWLSGDDGDDLIDGGDGNDLIREQTQQFPGGPVAASGDDVGIGGEGDDGIQLGDGADRAEGGLGNDVVWGGEGDDLLSGAAGNDTLGGEGGVDEISGGEGDDVVKSGLLQEWAKFPPPVIDSWADAIDCGPGSDEAELNRWDAARACEKKKLVRFASYGKTKRNRAHGTVKIPIRVAGLGKLTVRGHGIAPLSKRAHKVWKEGEPSALVTVRARGRTAKELRKKGHVKLRVWVEWEPDGGLPRAEPRKLTLVRAR